MVLAIMAGWSMKLLDIKGAFLIGKPEAKAEPVYTKVPKGFEGFYPKNVLLMMIKLLYGRHEAAVAFWKELVKALSNIGYKKSKADPCTYFKWGPKGLNLMLSWIDDCSSFGFEDEIEKDRKEMFEYFDCDNVGDMIEYVGCKIERNEDAVVFTQPVLLQSFEDEYGAGKGARRVRTPAMEGKVLEEVAEEDAFGKEKTTLFRRGIGKLLHMMRWSRPEIQNSVRDLSRHMKQCGVEHQIAMERVMAYCVQDKEKGWILKPSRKWNGKDRYFLFKVRGKSDSDYAADKKKRRSVSGFVIWLEEAPIMCKSMMQDVPALSVTEAELMSGTSCGQYMVYVKKYLENLGLKVELPMLLEIDNKGAVDLINGFSTNGRTKHIDTRLFWLRELKERNIIKVRWVSGKNNEADLFTKNLGNKEFEKYTDRLISKISKGEKKVRFKEEEEKANVVYDAEIREAVEMRFADRVNKIDQRKLEQENK
jgi:hypothetical protein